jgi:DNA replicative helicase MCM subunit Mcm2 (Cdc46/Mcm family)
MNKIKISVIVDHIVQNQIVDITAISIVNGERFIHSLQIDSTDYEGISKLELEKNIFKSLVSKIVSSILAPEFINHKRII